MRGAAGGCASCPPPLLPHPPTPRYTHTHTHSVTHAHSFFLPPHQLCMNISSGDVGLQQQDGVEMRLHHLSRPLSSSHPFIPPSHTLFMLLLNLADCQFPGLLFHQVAFFHYLPDRFPTLPLRPRHSFLSFSFRISFYSLLSPPLPPCASLTDSLCARSISRALPPSPLCAQEV